MNIQAEEITLTLSAGEAIDLAYHIKNSLKESIDSHYIQKNHDSYNGGLEGHAKPLFEEQCRKDMNIMNKLMACSNGSIDNWLEKELWLYLEEQYNKINLTTSTPKK
jgi:hypothetical protein